MFSGGGLITPNKITFIIKKKNKIPHVLSASPGDLDSDRFLLCHAALKL